MNIREDFIMIIDHRPALRSLKMPARKTLQKRGTIAVAVVEATPVVWKGELLRFEWMRNNEWDTAKVNIRTEGFYHFVHMETNVPTPGFAYDHAFGCCHVEDEIMYVHGVRGPGGGNVLDAFWSSDLVHWQEKEILRLPEDVKIFNTSVCKGDDGYIMAIEIGGQNHPWVGRNFTCIFAKSTDLLNWELMDPMTYSYDKSRYTACPVLRYVNGWYYMICLEALPVSRYVPYITRTKDFESFEMGHYNPVMWFDDNDRLVEHPEWFTEEHLEYIANSPNCNVSDLDICDYNGKTIILYSWGNQMGNEFLACAEYDGSSEEFLESFYVN